MSVKHGACSRRILVSPETKTLFQIVLILRLSQVFQKWRLPHCLDKIFPRLPQVWRDRGLAMRDATKLDMSGHAKPIFNMLQPPLNRNIQGPNQSIHPCYRTCYFYWTILLDVSRVDRDNHGQKHTVDADILHYCCTFVQIPFSTNHLDTEENWKMWRFSGKLWSFKDIQ